MTHVHRTQIDGGPTRPLVCTDQWRSVMTTALYTCQCTGTCGATHKKSKGRCDAAHDEWSGSRRVRLIAAPTNPTLPVTASAGLAPDRLMAWCQKCYDGTRLAARKAAAAATPQPSADDTLFPVELLED